MTDPGDVACDGYHRLGEDLELMGALGLTAYRFSIAWPRVVPAGTGKVNQAGLDFYDRLVDGLLERDIEPFPTLYHWDLPQPLQKRAGGWASREVVGAFARYAEAVVRRLGDRVRYWITVNEPRVMAQLGHRDGEYAPGHEDLGESLRVAHHALLGHATAMNEIRLHDADAVVGIVLDPNPIVPSSDDEADVTAARLRDGTDNRWYLDPLAGKGYPEDAAGHMGVALDFVRPADLVDIAAPIDFLGINYYRRELVGGRRAAAPLPTTAMGWEIWPEGLAATLARLADEYPFPRFVITESGAAFDDELAEDGSIPDADRLEYLQAHVAALARAIEAGVTVDGYFVWSLLDNLEWTSGLGKRFGLVRVDFETQERTIKASGEWYRDLIARWRAENAGG